MTEKQAEALNDFLMQNWEAWSAFCEARDVEPYDDAFAFEELATEEHEDNSCQICGEDGGTKCGAVNCGY